jgi:hypothetical protein
MTRLDRWIDSFIMRVRDDPRTVNCKVGPEDDPLITRYFVIPRNRFLNVYLHSFHRSDRGELHDHRMGSISVVLQGRYFEQRFVTHPVEGEKLPLVMVVPVLRLRPVARRATTPHRVLVEDGTTVWSLFIGLPHIRNWGFWHEVRGRAHWYSHEEVGA